MARPKGYKINKALEQKLFDDNEALRQSIEACLAQEGTSVHNSEEDQALAAWWNAMPDPHDYAKIHPRIAAELQHLKTQFHEVEKFAKAEGKNPGEDREFRRILDEIRSKEQLLNDIWIAVGEQANFLHPKLYDKERRALIATCSIAVLAEKEGYENAHAEFEAQQRIDTARDAAEADKRGHTAPLEANALCLVREARASLSKEDLKAFSFLWDCARLISWDNPKLWPTMHDLVMTFAERDEVIRPKINLLPQEMRDRITKTRPVRYPPDIVLALVNQWLDGPGTTAEDWIRERFAKVKECLPV